jgi:inner membrane transporter RhtA
MTSPLMPTVPISPIYLNRSASLLGWFSRSAAGVQRLGQMIPPSGLVLLSCFAVQLGTATAKSLFVELGAIGTVFLCSLFATVWLFVSEGLSLPGLLSLNPAGSTPRYRAYGLILLLGLAMAGMSFCIYAAIARIPMGIASTLEFVGPLGVAMLGTRRGLDWIWVVLAGLGVILLAPITGTALDPLGILLALLSGCCWAAYILVSAWVGQLFPKQTGLALSMLTATALLAIPGVMQGGRALLHPAVLGVAAGVALLGKVLPYSLEFTALKRMPPRLFGVLMSIEPAIAALVGWLALSEALSLRSLLAILLVTVAAMGATLTGRR